MRLLSKVLSWLRPVRSLDEERAAAEAREAERQARLVGRASPNEMQATRDFTQ